MSAPVAPEVVPAESLTVTPPPAPVQDLAAASADFIAKYRTQQASEAAGAKEPETVVPAPDAPVVTPEGEKVEGEPEVKPEEGKPEGETPEASKFRNPDGTFAKTIKAKWGDTEIEVPEGLLLPLKRGDVVEYEALSETQKRGMLYNDYNKSKQELADQRRTFAAENAAAKAEVQVWKGIAKDILENPAKAMKYRQDPEMANLWADAAEGRLVQARQEAMAEIEQQHASTASVAQIRGWAEAMAGEFPGVDVPSVLRDYGDYLYQHGEAVKAGRTAEDPGAISMERLRNYFTQHHSRVAAVVSPLQTEVEALKAKLAALEAKTATETQQKAVQHAAKRADAPPVMAGTGGVAQGNTGAVTAPGGRPMDIGSATKEFLKRYQ